MDRIDIDGDYLIIAPRGPPKYGNWKMLTERAFLVDNVLNFITNHNIKDPHIITIYELRQVNEQGNVQTYPLQGNPTKEKESPAPPVKQEEEEEESHTCGGTTESYLSGVSHNCKLPEGHEGNHKCNCGHSWDDEEEFSKEEVEECQMDCCPDYDDCPNKEYNYQVDQKEEE